MMRYIPCVVLAALSVSVISEYVPRSCTNLILKNEKNCSCSEIQDRQEIKCPNANMSFSGGNSNQAIIVTCNAVIPSTIALPTLNVGSVKLLELQGCLPTAVSIRDIMVRLSVGKLYRLSIKGKLDSLAKGQLANLTEVVRLGGLGLTHVDQNIFVDQDTTESAIRALYLGRNNISRLEDTAFIKLKQLEDLNLSDNQLSNLPKDLFVHNKNLKVMVLMNNRLQNISRNKPLRIRPSVGGGSIRRPATRLRTKHFGITPPPSSPSIGSKTYNGTELFRNQVNLRVLFLSDNQLKHLEGEWEGLDGLSYLDLSNNQLVSMGVGMESVLRNVGQFGMRLILSNNNLTRAYRDWLTRGKMVDLENNNIQTFKMDSLNSWTFNLTLTLVGNNITEVYIDVSDPYIDFLEIDLAKNPLICNCHLHSLALSKPYGRVNITDSESITCGSPPSLKGRLVKDLTLEELKCPNSDGPK